MGSKSHPAGTRRPVTQDMREQMAEQYRSGAGLIEVAREHGTSVPTVAKALDAMGVPRRPRGHCSPAQQRLRDEQSARDVAEAVRLRREGMSLSDIGVALHHSFDWVRDALPDDLAEPLPPERSFTDAECAMLRQRYEAGELALNLAHEFGVTDKTVGRAIVRAGGSTIGRGQHWKHIGHERKSP